MNKTLCPMSDITISTYNNDNYNSVIFIYSVVNRGGSRTFN